MFRISAAVYCSEEQGRHLIRKAAEAHWERNVSALEMELRRFVQANPDLPFDEIEIVSNGHGEPEVRKKATSRKRRNLPRR